jgi:hypothetical protein
MGQTRTMIVPHVVVVTCDVMSIGNIPRQNSLLTDHNENIEDESRATLGGGGDSVAIA